MTIKLEHVQKTYGTFAALSDVSLTIKSGEMLALLGPSGSGKTTLLRILGGLEAACAGQMRAELGENQRGDALRVGFVFQNYALFRHMTVADNIAFGLTVRPRRHRPSRSEIKERVANLLHFIQLDGLGDRYPSQLSGGQRQRVALARALAIEPNLLLLDEPFGALDARVRQELRRWVRRVHDELKITTVFVTHDQEEALEIADRVAVMNQGRIEQIGTPSEVYHEPTTPFVCEFIGKTNRLDSSETWQAGFIRPHEIEVQLRPSGTTSVPAVIQKVRLAGPFVAIEAITKDETVLEAHLSPESRLIHELVPGRAVWLDMRKAKVFTNEEESIPVSAEQYA